MGAWPLPAELAIVRNLAESRAPAEVSRYNDTRGIHDVIPDDPDAV